MEYFKARKYSMEGIWTYIEKKENISLDNKKYPCFEDRIYWLLKPGLTKMRKCQKRKVMSRKRKFFL